MPRHVRVGCVCMCAVQLPLGLKLTHLPSVLDHTPPPDFGKKQPKFHGQGDKATAANSVEYNSFDSNCGPLYPIMFIDTDSFDIPDPVGQSLADVLFEQMDERGYDICLLYTSDAADE